MNAGDFEQSYAALKAAIRGGYIDEYVEHNPLERFSFNDNQLSQTANCLQAERFVRKCKQAFGLNME